MFLTQNKVVIALCGHMRCGKDTLASHMVINYGFQNLKIASHLKNIVKLAFDLTDDDVEGASKDHVHPNIGVKPRLLMDFIGTQVFQYDIGKVLPNIEPRCFWINYVMRQMEDKERVVISDLRFLHEHKKLKERFPKALVIKIERPSHTSDSLQYISETEIEEIPYDIRLINDSDSTALFQKCEKALNDLQL
jgi:hypothetical protein